MRRFLAVLVLCSAVIAPRPVLAQEGPEWELQRCIWRCLAGRGADDPAYTACVEQQCVDETGPQISQTPQPPAFQPPRLQVPVQGALGQWSFASYGMLGPSLGLQLPDGVIGFACPDPNFATMQIRLSNGLFRLAHLTLLIDGPDGTGATSVAVQQGQAWSAGEGSACTALLDRLDRATQITLVPGRIHAITQTARGTEITVAQDDLGYTVLSAGQGLGIPGARALPVSGLAPGFAALMSACPAARADLADFCGL